MAKHLVKFDAATRKSLHMYEANSDGDIILETKVDTTELTEINKAMYRQVDERARWGEGDLVARIPPAVYWSLPKHIREDEKEFEKWLDDPDQRVFRTRPGRLSR